VTPRLLFVSIVLLGACKNASPGGAGGPGGGGPPPMPVDVMVAQGDTVIETIPATGQIEAVQSIELRPEVEGRVVAFLAQEGREIEKGGAIIKVDDAELTAQVARAAAERDLASQALARTRQLMTQNASSTADLERAEATARSAQAQLDLLQIRLDRTTVRAPFAGVVGQRLVSIGDFVNSGSRLVTLHTVNPQRAAFRVPERYGERLARGQRVGFQVASLPGQEFFGTVDFVDPVVQLPGRTILIKAVVPNPRRQLEPGMFIEAHLVTEVRPNAVVVPEDAVIALQGATFAWVVVDGKADRRTVVIGQRSPGYVELLSGVKAGEQVIVGGQERIGPGSPVMPSVVNRDTTTAERP